MIKKIVSVFVCTLFFIQTFLVNIPIVQADSDLLALPLSDRMMSLSQPLQPVMLQGLRYDPQKPFQFQFILQQGDAPIPLDQLRDKGMELVRYFMAAMTIPKEDLWVNLSPYEKDRIVADGLDVTRLGSDMLIEDYILKQLSSSLTFPDSRTGRAFWQKIYNQAQLSFGKTGVPISTFNKVWIVPDYADVLIKDNTVVILDSHLKVMMEQDYLAKRKASCGDSCLQVRSLEKGASQNLASDVMRQVIIPVLEKEVNTGAHFAALRQMFHAVVLAEWYKRNLKDSILSQSYANRHKVVGIDDIKPQAKEVIYKRYLSAYKKGVYNFIREDSEPVTGQIVARKYFAGGLNLDLSPAMLHERYSTAEFSQGDRAMWFHKNLSYLMDVGAEPASNFVAGAGVGKARLASPEIQKVFDDTEAALKRERQVAPSVRKLMDPIDPLLINMVVDHPVRQINGINTVDLSHNNGYVDIIHSRIGLNIPFTPNEAELEGGATTKGGIRWYIEGSTLFKDEVFAKGWSRLNDLKASRHIMYKFVSLFMKNGAWNLAFLMFEKVKLLGLPLGGAKADLTIGNIVGEVGDFTIQDLDKEDIPSLHKIAESHADILAPFVGLGKDIPAPDVGTGSNRIMEIYAEQGIRWLVKNRPQEFKYPDLIKNLRTKLGEIDKNPDQYPPVNAELLKMVDAFATAHRVPMPQTATYSGTKSYGALNGREEATGIGVIIALMTYFKEMGIDYHGMTISLDGLGAVGYNAGLFAIENGFVVTDFSDLNIAVRNPNGWRNAEEFRKIKECAIKSRMLLWQFFLEDRNLPENVRVFAKPGIEALINQEPPLIDGKRNPKYSEIDERITDQVLGAKVDILIPAAFGIHIKTDNWHLIKAKYLAEGANKPADPEAERQMVESKRFVILSGILANSLGVYSSYLQLLQSLQDDKFTLNQVRDMGSKKISQVTLEVGDILKKYSYLSFGEACEFQAWKNAAADRLKNVIDWEAGQFNDILKYYRLYEPNLTPNVLMRRIVMLGLSQYLKKVQITTLEMQRRSIVEIISKLIDSRLQDIQTIYDIVVEATKGANLGETVANTRALYNMLQKNETIEQAIVRLSGLMSAQEVVELHGSLKARIEDLRRRNSNEVLRENALSVLGSNVLRNNAMTVNGGIDFNTSRMLINQKGEANFAQITSASNTADWQQIKGLSPVFLRLAPVNLSELMGVV